MGGGDPTQVKLYTSPNCSGTVAATGTVAQFTGAGITVNVGDNSTTNLSARAFDAAGNQSACSNSISYAEVDPLPTPRRSPTPIPTRRPTTATLR